ncbi:YggS family pyridoxal phosphate-dependent enzyme [Leucothrix mucor]|uniref:YggS family pyridoxal phosphate-dependent enzyme n=1 Tax=Leucothrix mucor TaxID=45248 RepID=UPI0003B4C5A3|nr:YggS family pyridoxal phosphate-dependent enzyme [Leucothrix mucor]
MSKIPQNLQTIGAEIAQYSERYHRPAHSVRLLAVSKRHPADAIREAYDCGQRAFGENYAQEMLEKAEELSALEIEWHFIGPLQSNKTKDVAATAHWVHAIDRLKIARRLSEQRPSDLPALKVCLQVNVNDEASKSGVSVAELPELAAQVSELPGIKLRGLMAIPEATHDPVQQRANFAILAKAQADLNAAGYDLDTLSMGMSDDMEAAIAEGATMVRIGTAIFGARN